MNRSPLKAAYYQALGARSVYEDDYFHAAIQASNNITDLVAVADGMGGLGAGEEASQAAMATAKRLMLSAAFKISGSVGDQQIMRLLRHVLAEANQEVLDLAQGRSMGTTLTVGVFTDTHLYIGHAGDCRAYAVSPQQVRQLTEDHAVGHKLTNRLGKDQDLTVALYKERLAPDNIYLFCSDGLHGQLDPMAIFNGLGQTPTLIQGCIGLVHQAWHQAPRRSDNITVVALENGNFPRRAGRDQASNQAVAAPGPAPDPEMEAGEDAGPTEWLAFRRKALWALLALVVVFVAAFTWLSVGGQPSQSDAAGQAPAAGGIIFYAALAVAVVVLAGLAVLLFSGRQSKTDPAKERPHRGRRAGPEN